MNADKTSTVFSIGCMITGRTPEKKLQIKVTGLYAFLFFFHCDRDSIPMSSILSIYDIYDRISEPDDLSPVYHACRKQDKQSTCIKFTAMYGGTSYKHKLLESERISKLDCEYLIKLYGCSIESDLFCRVMEFAGSCSLNQFINVCLIIFCF